jgi:hypothetical protein
MGTALLRSDLYSDSIRNEFRHDFKDYIEARLAYYNSIADTVLFNKAKRDAENAATLYGQEPSSNPNYPTC